MNNQLTNFWCYLKFWFAGKPGNNSLANLRLRAMENLAVQLSLSEKLYENKLKFQKSFHDKDREIKNLTTGNYHLVPR